MHLKLDPDAPLSDAHEVAERVEAAIRADPEVDYVYPYLEPVEHPVAASDQISSSDEAERERITRLVVERTGQAPRELRLLHTDDGLVVFVSVAAPTDMRLPDAHELASRLEDDIRDGRPHMADVVVHTEP